MTNETFIIENGHLKKCTDTDAAVICLPDEVTVIRSNALKDLVHLEEICLGTRLHTIESKAFEGCEKLKTVRFGSAEVHLEEGVFRSAVSPLTVYYPGTQEDWTRITAPRIEERNRFYDGGWGGGAPGFSWDEYKVFPLYHKDEEAFVCRVFCLADGKELICRGGPRSVLVARHSPYFD